jgi:geranylgeranyl pyrophosphate synthase
MLDDLPVMDNASSRRGKPAIHKIFKPQTTILAATSLAAKGFEILSRELSKRDASASVVSILIEMSAKMLGLEGASGGQFLDLTSKTSSETDLLYIHMKKTSSLFYLCGLISAEIGQLSEYEKSAILEYVRHVGLLFQLVDDHLDMQNDNKYNFARVIGTEKIKQKIENERNQAIWVLEQLNGDTTILRSIVDYIVSRCG